MKKKAIGLLAVFGVYTAAIFWPNEQAGLVMYYLSALFMAVLLIGILIDIRPFLKDKTYWWFVLAVILCQGIATSIATVRELLLGLHPDSFLGDFFLAGIPISLIVSVWYVSFKEKDIKNILKRTVGATALIISFAYFMYLICFSGIATIDQFIESDWVIRIFLGLDLILVVSVVLSYFRASVRAVKRRYVVIKSLGMLAYTLADMIYLVLVDEAYITWGGILDLLWTIGIGLMVLSVFYEARDEVLVRQQIPGKRDYTTLLVNILGILALVIVASLNTTTEYKILVTLFLVIGLMYMTQIDVYLQKHHLQNINGLLEEQMDQINQLNNELVVTNKKLEDTAKVDFLTQLGNRRFLEIEMDALLQANHTAESPGFTLLAVDLNRFKSINDWYGHPVGDAVIVAIARCLERAVPSDCIVTRQGGDEFTVLVPNLYHKAAIEPIVQAILDEATGPMVIAGHAFDMALSMGVARYPIDGSDKDVLMKSVDIAMYEAKKLGDNYVVFAKPTQGEAISRKKEIEHLLKEIHYAETFLVDYEPEIDLEKAGVLSGFTLGFGWEHPRLGYITADEILTIAEESGDVMPLSRWLLEEGIRFIVAWNRQYKVALKVSIPLSAKYFFSKNFSRDLETLVEKYAAEGSWLGVELREEVFLKAGDDMAARLTYLKQCGIQRVLGDFGTGCIALKYLSPLYFDKVKIHCDGLMAQHQAIKQLMDLVGIDVIITGIITQEQMERMQNATYYKLQGPYFKNLLTDCQVNAYIKENGYA